MRYALDIYPSYLYDKTLLNDYEYLFNRDVIFSRTYPIELATKQPNFSPGITTFDDYQDWFRVHGTNKVCPNGLLEETETENSHLTEDEKNIIHQNIKKNVTSLAQAYPCTDFYYFFSPYSAAWWQKQVANGTLDKQLEAEEYIINELLQYNNIKLFSFNNRTDIITDLNNYSDSLHYGDWINSLMLKWMLNGQYQLTSDNYKDYLTEVYSFYSNYDYSSLLTQEDYEADYYAAALLNKEYSGTTPLTISFDILKEGLSDYAFIRSNKDYEHSIEFDCHGALQRNAKTDTSIQNYLLNTEYTGCKFNINNVDNYRYLLFWGKKGNEHGQPSVFIYNDKQEVVAQHTAHYSNLDNEWHQYAIDISDITGNITIIFNGAYTDSTGSPDSLYTFKDITLY